MNIAKSKRASKNIKKIICSTMCTFLVLSQISPVSASTNNLETASGRDPWLHPFSQDSIWNMPLGEGAVYSEIGVIPRTQFVSVDPELYYKTKSTDPLQPIYSPHSWTERGKGTDEPLGQTHMHIADDIIVEDAIAKDGVYETPNNISVFLQPDGHTILELEPLCRPEAGSPVWGYQNPVGDKMESLYGTGYYGSHFGSGLSGIGGSLRYGELTGTEPINHALKINVWGKYLYYDQETKIGYRWPADRHDSYAPQGYKGTNTDLQMGSMLAIPPHITAESLGLKTEPAKKIFHALQNYGAYIVDDTGWDSVYFPGQREIIPEFEEKFGYSMIQFNPSSGPAKDWFDDINNIVVSLAVVTNSSPETIGGGGETRRAPLVDPNFKPMDSVAPTTPSNLRVVDKTISSITLKWDQSSDDVQLMGYDIYQDGKKVAETFGVTTKTIKELTPNTEYTFTIKAKDTNYNISEESNTVTETTYRGYAENFNGTSIDGWNLINAKIVNGKLEIGNWEAEASAIHFENVFHNQFKFDVDISAAGSAVSNCSKILFNYINKQNYYAVVNNGDNYTGVRLIKVVNGTKTVLASVPDFNMGWGKVEVNFDRGKITVKSIKSGTTTVLFDAIQDAALTYGKIGFASEWNKVTVDNLNVYAKTIKSISDVAATVEQGLNYTLPTKVTAVMSDDTTEEVSVIWAPNSVSTASVGTFQFDGTVEGYAGTFKLMLTVTESPYDRYNEDFTNMQQLIDWSLNSASIENGRLKLENWGGDARAIYDAKVAGGRYEYSINLNVSSGDEWGYIYLFFNYQDANNTYYVKLDRRDTNVVSLRKIVKGTDSLIKTYSGSYRINDWTFPTIKISYDGTSSITVTASKNNVETVLFDNVQDTSLKPGKIGFLSRYSTGLFDNLKLSIHKTIEQINPPSDLHVVLKDSSSIRLGWSAPSSGAQAAGYNVYRDNVKIATVNDTSYTVTGLQPTTNYGFMVKAKDEIGNLSAPTAVLTARTSPLPGELDLSFAENFNGTSLTGWTVSNPTTVKLNSGKLQIGNFEASASAIYTGSTYYNQVKFNLDLSAVGDAVSNCSMILFNYVNNQNYYAVVNKGDNYNGVRLIKVASGTKTVLASVPDYNINWAKVEVSYNRGKITVKSTKSGTTTVLFDALEDAAHTYGKIGFASEWNMVNVDNLYVYGRSIASIADISAKVKSGESYTLPTTVTAIMSDESSEDLIVTWSPNTASTDSVGIFEFNGSVEGYEGTVRLILTVTAKTDTNPLRIEMIDTQSSFTLGSDAKVRIRVTNNTESSKDATLVVALFDGNKMITYSAAKQTILKDGQVELEVMLGLNYPALSGRNYTVKYLVWEDLDSGMPIPGVEPEEIPVQ